MGKFIFILTLECGHVTSRDFNVKAGTKITCPDCMAARRVVKSEQQAK